MRKYFFLSKSLFAITNLSSTGISNSLYPVLWPDRMRVVNGTSSSALAIGATNASCQLMGLVGPVIYQSKFGPSYYISYSCSIALCSVSCTFIGVTWYLVRSKGLLHTEGAIVETKNKSCEVASWWVHGLRIYTWKFLFNCTFHDSRWQQARLQKLSTLCTHGFKIFVCCCLSRTHKTYLTWMLSPRSVFLKLMLKDIPSHKLLRFTKHSEMSKFHQTFSSISNKLNRFLYFLVNTFGNFHWPAYSSEY